MPETANVSVTLDTGVRHHTFEGDLSGSWATRVRDNTVVDVEKV